VFSPPRPWEFLAVNDEVESIEAFPLVSNVRKQILQLKPRVLCNQVTTPIDRIRLQEEEKIPNILFRFCGRQFLRLLKQTQKE